MTIRRNKETDQITITKLQTFGAIIVAIIGLVGTFLAGKNVGNQSDTNASIVNVYPNVVPQTPSQIVDSLPGATPS
jgi:uncharacterized membrane protein